MFAHILRLNDLVEIPRPYPRESAATDQVHWLGLSKAFALQATVAGLVKGQAKLGAGQEALAQRFYDAG